MPNTLDSIVPPPQNLLIPETLRNRVYFSSHIRAYRCWSELQAALLRQHVSYDLLLHTKDIWARDYMPVQCAYNRYITYNYDPDYLRTQPQYITRWNQAIPSKSIPWYDAGLRLDGGNIIMCDDKVILTDKIFYENPALSHREVLRRLEEAFMVKPVIIPWDKEEPYGHADGMVRYVGNNRVLLTNYSNFDLALRQRLLQALQPHFEVLELHYDVVHPHKWNWAYINYLLVGGSLFIPCLHSDEDEQAFVQLGDVLGILHKHIELIDINTVLRAGGGLNCISWTILK